MFPDLQSTTPVLPDYLIFNTPRSVFAFLLAGVPANALRGITHLRVQFPDLVYEPSNEVHQSYLTAVRILLRILPNLEDLVLLWTNVPPSVFDGVTFRLVALTCTMSFNDFEGLKFLTMQDELTLLELPHWRSSALGRPFFPREALLPDLGQVSLPPAGIMQLVPTRPVHSADVRLAGRRVLPRMRTIYTKQLDSEFEPRGDLGRFGMQEEDPSSGGETIVQLESHQWPPLMRALQDSASVVDDLAIATLDQFDPDVVLRAVARHLPHLRSLYLRAYTPEDTTQELFQWGSWAVYLSHLPHLRSIKVEFDCKYVARSRSRARQSPSPTPEPCAEYNPKNTFFTLPSPLEPPPTRHQEPLVRFSIPTESCMEVWAKHCCPWLDNVYVGVFGGDTLVDWVPPPR